MSSQSSGPEGPLRPRAVYVAIGTELTSGQITNRNSAWISSRLEALGVEVQWHLCVPDDRRLMLEALELAASRGELIFVSGGLGPTSDDFTREVVAQWWGEKLEWHEPTWARAVERLARRGIRAPESGKQQAWYPRGAEVLINREGTADGFRIERAAGPVVFVLPGPPREIEAIWQDHIASGLRSWLASRYGELRPIEPLRWAVLGKSEAQIADLVEDAVRGSGLLTGYRAHPPYVEVKIWIPAHLTRETPAVAAALARLEAAVGGWTVARGDEDLVARFFSRLDPSRDAPVKFVDACTPGLLSERIWNWGRASPRNLEVLKRLQISVVSTLVGQPEGGSGSIPPSGTRITLGPLVQLESSAGSAPSAVADVRWDHAGGRTERLEIEVPFPAAMQERQWLLAVEKLLV